MWLFNKIKKETSTKPYSKGINAKEKGIYVSEAVKRAEMETLSEELNFYKVSFHMTNGLVISLHKAKAYKGAAKNFTLHKVFLVDASAISQDGELTVERKLAADFYDKRGSNVAILGFRESLPAWVFDSIGDDLYFVRR